METISLKLFAGVFLFLVGIVGILKERSVIKILISFEILIMASILNFCGSSSANFVDIGSVAAISGVVAGGLVFSVIVFLYSLFFKDI